MNSSSFIVVLVCIWQLTSLVDAVLPQYTDKEKAAIVKFRELVKDDIYKDYMSSEPYLVRWIRARDFDLVEAHKMLKAAMKWRKDNGIDGIIKEFVFEFQSVPFYADGIDKEGSVVATVLPARVDMRRHLLNGKRYEAIRYFDQLLENQEIGSLELLGILPEGSSPLLNTTGIDRSKLKTSDKGVAIFDFHGYSLKQHACLACFSVYLEWTQHMEDYYPGYLKRLIIVNAPRIAIPLVNILKTAMSPATRDALEIYGSKKSDWLPVLRKYIEPDQLRAILGGTKED